jgi:hypothetical protein
MSGRLQRLMQAVQALPDEQFAGAYPIVLMMVNGADPTNLPPVSKEVVRQFIADLGWTATTTAEQMRETLEQHGRRFHLTDGLWRELMAAMAASPTSLQAAVKATGGAAVGGALQRTAPPPPGAVAAGPMARFAALQVAKKE